MEIGEPVAVVLSAAPKRVKRDKVWMLQILALAFKTDHALIRDNDANWTKSGALFPEPEWQRSPHVNVPITHTRKEKIQADATFTVPLSKADTKSATPQGSSSTAALSFKASAAESFGPGSNEVVSVTAGSALPDLIGVKKGNITWRAKADKFYPAGVSGMHVVYVTYDLPIDTGLVEDGVTLHRMKKTIAWFGKAWAAGKRKPADLIESVFAKFSGYVLGFEMLSRAQRTYLVRHPAALAKLEDAGFPTFMKDAKGGAWPLAEFSNYGGECQAIVRLTRAMAHQVGLPGTFQIKYVSSQPADPYKTRILDDPSVDPAGPLPGWDYALVDGAVSVGGQYGAADGVGFNRYEAFLKYTDGGVITWFGGGIGRMPASTKEDDLVKVFWGLAALSAGDPDPASGGRKFKIEHVWKY